MSGAYFLHAMGALVFMVVAIVFYALILADPKLRRYDSTALYTYSKYVPDLDNLAFNLQDNSTYSWLDSSVKSENCGDLRGFDFPKVQYLDPVSGAVTNFLPGNAGCLVQWTWVNGIASNPVASGITGVALAQPSLCVGGTSYTMVLNKFDNTGSFTTITGPLTLSISSGLVPSFNHVGEALATGLSSQGSTYTTCLSKRAQLSAFLNTVTDCSHENSQFCSCVYLLSQPVTKPSFVFPNATQRSVKVSSLLLDGVRKCSALRRSRDKYAVFSSSDHKQSQMLFLIIFSLLMNLVYHLIAVWLPDWPNYTNLMAMVLGILVFSGVSLATSGSVSWLEALMIAALGLLVGGYYEYFFVLGSDVKAEAFPTVHPMYFGVVYACLTNYVLVERGVVQLETLVVEIFKSFGVAFLYSKIVIYYITQNDDAVSRRAQLLALLLVLVIGADVLFTPYGDDKEFALVWLLPLAFVVVTTGEKSWIDQVSNKDNSRHLMFSLMHLFLFWVCSHWFSEYTRFMNVYSHGSPLDNRVLSLNPKALMGMVHELN